MSSQSENEENLAYIKPEDQIYDVAMNKDVIDWKSFLYELIYKGGLDPWDIDLGLLTKKYILSLKELKEIDFDVSGKFLTIAVFLLKTKTEALLEKDIRGIENSIASIESYDESFDDLDSLEDFDDHLTDLSEKKKSKYTLRYRNPIARKRKVTIFDLIKTLEKTFEQSNRRRANFFQRSGDAKYDGPMYEKKPKDLKQLIEELYDHILQELKFNKKGHVHFGHLVRGIEDKMGVLEKFIPLLHLHNSSKIKLEQENHFGEIKINKWVEK